jgi:hypothetical protein
MSSSFIGLEVGAGVQHFSVFLPVIGAKQCSEQVSSALSEGYLKAAATPLSIFGSVGLIKAGFKTLLACFSFGNIEGAKILGKLGFKPEGENLSLIMVDGIRENNKGRYVIETRMDELIKEFGIDKNRITGVSHKSGAWNNKMMITTALLSAFSIAPFFYLNPVVDIDIVKMAWVFSLVMRAIGGFITATLIPLLIQRRIVTLSDQYLVKRGPDVEASVEPGGKKKHQMDARTWLLLFLLLIGLVTSVVGYFGYIAFVLIWTSNIGFVYWICAETGLCVMRLVIWGKIWGNSDPAPPLEIILELVKYEHISLPICSKDNEDILQHKVLPLTRARDFLKIIGSFVGLIEPFNNPDLSLYYTLARNRPSQKSVNEEKHKLEEWTLYITIFDLKEHTTRIYTRVNEKDTLYSKSWDAPFIDSALEVKFDLKMDFKDDPVFRYGNNNLLDLLRKHHRSILENFQYRLGAGNITTPYAIENNWTMAVTGTTSSVQRLRQGEKLVNEIGGYHRYAPELKEGRNGR